MNVHSAVLAGALSLAAAFPLHAASKGAAAEQAAAPVVESPVKPPVPEGQELNEQLFYQFLLAEIAGQRGNLSLAADAYLDLARNTRDPRLAQRATEIALFAREPDTALEAVKLWLEREPGSAKAKQLAVALMVNAGRLDQARPLLKELIAEDSGNVGRGFLHLNGLFSRQSNRQAVLELVSDLATPYPHIPEAHFAVAQAAWNAERRERALGEIRETLRLKPDWEDAARFQGMALRRVAPAEAGPYYEAFLAGHPKAREMRLDYARLLVNDRRYDEARRQFRLLGEEFQTMPEVSFAVGLLAFQLGDLDDARANLKRAMEQGYPELSSVRFYLGQVAEAAKKPEEAREWYTQVGPGDDYIPAQVRLATLLAKEGKVKEAAAFLGGVKVADPAQQARLVMAEAQMLREIKDYRGAFEVLDRAVKKFPANPDLLYDRALAAEKVKRLDVMEKDLRRAIQLKPDFAQAYNALGYTFVERNERLEEAQKLLDQANRLEPDDPFILDSLGWLSFRRGDLARAEDFLRQALAQRRDPDIAAHLGEVLWLRGQKDEADKVWQEYLKENPDHDGLKDVVKRFTR